MAITIKKLRQSTTVLRKGNGDTLGPTVPRKVPVPAEPVYGRRDPGERTLHDEAQVVRVVYMMTKGIRERSQLMKLLDVPDTRSMDRYIERAKVHFETMGGIADQTRARGEGLMRLDLIEQALWEEVERNKGFKITGQEDGKPYHIEADSRAIIVALDKLLDVQRHRDVLTGLTQKSIERIGTTAQESTEFTRRVDAHEAVARVARLLLDRMPSPDVKTIDGTANR